MNFRQTLPFMFFSAAVVTPVVSNVITIACVEFCVKLDDPFGAKDA